MKQRVRYTTYKTFTCKCGAKAETKSYTQNVKMPRGWTYKRTSCIDGEYICQKCIRRGQQ